MVFKELLCFTVFSVDLKEACALEGLSECYHIDDTEGSLLF